MTAFTSSLSFPTNQICLARMAAQICFVHSAVALVCESFTVSLLVITSDNFYFDFKERFVCSNHLSPVKEK